MKTKNDTSSDPRVHAEKIEGMLDEIINHSREDVSKVDDPKFQALLETTAEVLTGVKTAFQHFTEGKEEAWKRG